jgi:deoxyribose-phosphate aldolase
MTEPPSLISPACLDSTLLNWPPYTSASEMEQAVVRFCNEAEHHGFAAVCVRPVHTLLARQTLSTKSTVKVATVVGFPEATLSKADEAYYPVIGQVETTTKLQEISQALMEGAEELDVVLNVSYFKTDLETGGTFTERELQDMVQATGGDALLKLIIETDLLTATELEQAVTLAVRCGMNMIKTSTGMLSDGAGATPETVAAIATVLNRLGVAGQVGVKASGGIRTIAQAQALLAAGATRLGSSNALALLGL